MPLKTVVKVGNISNLSDARYCAGMGAEMLGFSVIEGEKNYVSPTLFQEIRGWVSGPKIVAELYGIRSAAELSVITEHYQPDYFELTGEEFRQFGHLLNLPALIALEDNAQAAALPSVIYYIVEEALLAGLGNKMLTRPVLVRTASAEAASRILNLYPVSGLSLNGTPEIRPGYKDYDALSETLEMLDE